MTRLSAAEAPGISAATHNFAGFLFGIAGCGLAVGERTPFHVLPLVYEGPQYKHLVFMEEWGRQKFLEQLLGYYYAAGTHGHMVKIDSGPELIDSFRYSV